MAPEDVKYMEAGKCPCSHLSLQIVEFRTANEKDMSLCSLFILYSAYDSSLYCDTKLIDVVSSLQSGYGRFSFGGYGRVSDAKR